MLRKTVSFILALLIFTSLATPTYAASNTFLPSALSFYNLVCKQRVVVLTMALQCYVFDKVNELQQSLDSVTQRTTNTESKNNTQDQKILNLENKVASQEAVIADLTTRIINLEDSPLEPKIITFADSRPQPFNSMWVDVRGGYKNMEFKLYTTDFIVEYAIHYTNNPAAATDFTGYTVQHTVYCGGASVCPTTTLPLLGDYYRISTGTAGGNITSTATLTP